MPTDYRAQFQSDCDNCRTAIGAQSLIQAQMYYAMAEASKASMIEMKASDQGSSVDCENALKGLSEAIQMLRQMIAQDQTGGAIAMGVGRPRGLIGGSGMEYQN